jgi:predicted double-glycine peptidase
MVHKRIVTFTALIFFFLPVYSGSVHFNGDYSVNVLSIAEQRFKTIYKQKYDFSCGSATLARLLSFHYDDIVDEFTVFKDMFSHGDQDEIRKHGFSLLDMKYYLSRRGYQSNGFRISLEQLAKAHLPAITIINNKGYMHFVVIKGSNEKEVLVGDPALGLQFIDIDEFKKMWGKGILFIIQDKKEIANNYYKNKSEWNQRVKAQLGLAVDRSSLGLFNVLQPSVIDF